MFDLIGTFSLKTFQETYKYQEITFFFENFQKDVKKPGNSFREYFKQLQLIFY